jgi:adenylate cyclase
MLSVATRNSPAAGLATEFRRRLAAIAFADVAGWSRMTERDDAAATTAWKEVRNRVIRPNLPAFGGHIHVVPGDAVLVVFDSANQAVQWAIDLQRRLASWRETASGEPIHLRIGISVEDLIVDREEGLLTGDGINIAARLEKIASRDGVVVTQTVYDLVVGKNQPFSLHDIGERQLDGKAIPVRLFRVEPGASVPSGGRVQPHWMWESRPTLAVLPFNSESGEHDPYFGEGMTEEIITNLSRNPSMFVIARSSTLRYRGTQARPADIAAELGVRYLLSGVVRRLGRRLRINAELMDAGSGRTLWAQRYEGQDEDVFDFQEQIANRITAEIDPRVHEAEIARIRDRPTESFSAYECLLRAIALEYRFNAADFEQAGNLFRRAVELDPGYARAHAQLAWWHNLRVGEERSSGTEEDHERSGFHSRRAVELDPRDSLVLSVRGHILSFQGRRFEEALELFEQALSLNPSSAFSWALSATTLAYTGHGEEAIIRVKNAMRLSPFDPLAFAFHTTFGTACIVTGRFDEAIEVLRKARRLNPRYFAPLRLLVAAAALVGDVEQARSAAAELVAWSPAFRVSKFAQWYPLQPPHLERVLDGMRLAGLPD